MSFGKDDFHVTKKEGQLKPGQNLKCETEILVLVMKNSCQSGENLVNLIEKWAKGGTPSRKVDSNDPMTL